MRPVRHIAFIMDGNGRWASSQGMPRSYGHLQGYTILRGICEACYRHGVSVVSLYGLSMDNRQKRPVQEVQYLYELLVQHLGEFAASLWRQQIAFCWSGCPEGLPASVVEKLITLQMMSKTRPTTRLVNFAFNYSGRQEICDAARALIRTLPDGEAVTAPLVSQHSYHADIGAVDLLVRTGGEQRVSDFLLWQMGQAQLIFLESMWPEMTPEIVTQLVTTFNLPNNSSESQRPRHHAL